MLAGPFTHLPIHPLPHSPVHYNTKVVGLKNFIHDWEIVLAGLYLPGTPHGLHLDRRRWPAVLGSLRSQGACLADASGCLSQKGHFAEATALQVSGVMSWAESTFARGRVLTCLDDVYPLRWLSVLGTGAPPALWRLGNSNTANCLSIVGSRQVAPEVHRFCGEVARASLALGYRVVSGGAIGCDSAALQAAAPNGSTVVLFPYSVESWDGEQHVDQMILSLCVPGEPFSTGRAMERNSLIYAAGAHSVIGHCRYREGGTWHGAANALRRRHTQLILRKPESGETEYFRAVRALTGLGAKSLSSPDGLEAVVADSPSSADLFSALKVG